jgi:O-acetyl-ADP-ribose deacetylase (regulator of RNase III)
MKYQEIKGDLIELALSGSFDAIAHGCNCFSLQKSGIAVQMSKTFDTHAFSREHYVEEGNIDKLGCIDFEEIIKTQLGEVTLSKKYEADNIILDDSFKSFYVINAYTQYQPGKNLDYEALTLCLRKINKIFKGKHIGLPQIGCGIAGGIWDVNKFSIIDAESSRKYVKLQQRGFKDVKTIIQEELEDCDVTVVIYDK